jgi:hypothetical protein
VSGVFANPEAQSRALDHPGTGGPVRDALFRRKDGCRRTHAIMTGESPGGQAITVAVFAGLPAPPYSGFPASSA